MLALLLYIKKTNCSVIGYKIDTTQVPIELRSHMYRCTATYSTTEGGKRSRLRFLAESDIADDEKILIEDILSSFAASFDNAMSLKVMELTSQRHSMVSQFEESAQFVDR